MIKSSVLDKNQQSLKIMWRDSNGGLVTTNVTFDFLLEGIPHMDDDQIKRFVVCDDAVVAEIKRVSEQMLAHKAYERSMGIV